MIFEYRTTFASFKYPIRQIRCSNTCANIQQFIYCVHYDFDQFAFSIQSSRSYFAASFFPISSHALNEDCTNLMYHSGSNKYLGQMLHEMASDMIWNIFGFPNSTHIPCGIIDWNQNAVHLDITMKQLLLVTSLVFVLWLK